jgi:hypothetical protein
MRLAAATAQGAAPGSVEAVADQGLAGAERRGVDLLARCRRAGGAAQSAAPRTRPCCSCFRRWSELPRCSCSCSRPRLQCCRLRHWCRRRRPVPGRPDCGSRDRTPPSRRSRQRPRPSKYRAPPTSGGA